jgi:tetratricopeptide (TPR) repeat protein
MTRLPSCFRSATSVASLLVSCAITASVAAAPSPPPRQEPPPQAPAATSLLGDTLSAAAAKGASRVEAESLYAAGYRDVEKAKKDKKAGKDKDAKKRFGKARGKFEGAVRLDPQYFEAWNMLGYSARQSGDLKASFAAYDQCLAIKPDYDEAHEYRGEAYLMNGQIDQAKQELAWLRAEGSDEADELAEAIEKAEGKKAGSKDEGAKTEAAPESKESEVKSTEAKTPEAKSPEAK